VNKLITNKQGLLQALGITAYISLIGFFIGSGDKIVGNIGLPFAPVFVLLLLSVSVLICAVLVLYKPYKFFIDGKKKEALSMVISTAVWLSIFLVIFLGVIVIFK
jgi:hypothetical protein